MGTRVYKCHYCHGQIEVENVGDGRPWGWYTLSVNVPARMGKKGQPFMWVGLWCSAACLAADMPELEEQEQLARLAYQVDLPELQAAPGRNVAVTSQVRWFMRHLSVTPVMVIEYKLRNACAWSRVSHITEV